MLRLVSFAFAGLLMAVAAMPQGGAVDLGCRSPMNQGNEALVVVLPAGEFPDWTPECITFDSLGSVTFRQLDGLPHQAVAKGCFDSGGLNAVNQAQYPEANQVRFKWDPRFEKVIAFSPVGGANGGIKFCEPGDGVEFRDGTFPPARGVGLRYPVVEDHPDHVAVHFICAVHGPIMHGVVQVMK